MRASTILHVIPTLNVGGAEKQLALLVRNLDRSRFRPLVACTTCTGPVLEDLEACGVPVRVFNKRGRIDPGLVWRLRQWMRREKPDLVHTWMFTANTWGRLAAIAARVPGLIAAERCVDLWKGHLHRGIDRLLAAKTHRILANSKAVAAFLAQREHIPPSRICVIPNGLDPQQAQRLRHPQSQDMATLRRNLGIPLDALIVGDVSRIDAKNGLLAWVAVVQRLADRYPNLIALLAGGATLKVEHDYSRLLAEAIRQRGLTNRVRLLGFRRDLERVLPALDVFLHTSTMEGFPNSIMEAMAAGVPVVATDAGGTQELVGGGENGCVAPVGDIDALTKHSLALLADAQLRRRMGEAGARRVREHFSASRMVTATQEVYNEVLRETRRT